MLKLTPSRVGLPKGLTEAAWHQLVANSAAEWSYPRVRCSQLELTVLPSQWLRRGEDDSVNVIVFRDETWCHNGICGHLTTFPAQAAGLTTTYPLGAVGAAVTGGDVELNGVSTKFQWNDGPSVADASTVSLEAVVVHEIGHLLGLRDACAVHQGFGSDENNCPDPQRERVMFAPAKLSHPTATDIVELCQIHPRGQVTGTVLSEQRIGVVSSILIATVATLVCLAYAWTKKRRRT